jgi:hypothetical protein
LRVQYPAIEAIDVQEPFVLIFLGDLGALGELGVESFFFDGEVCGGW